MSSRVLALVLLAACSGGASHPAPPPGPPPVPVPAITIEAGDVAITHVTVVPMSVPGELPDQTVVIRGDRIAGLGPSVQVAVPAGVQIIDGKHGWLMPGLTDMHVHLGGDDDLTLFLAAGVTTVRNMFGSDRHLALRAAIAGGGKLGPTIVTAGPIIDGDPPVWPGSTVLADPAAADKIVADQKAAGYDFLKPYANLSKPAYEALAAAGAKYHMLLEGHVPDAVGLGGALDARQRTIEHLDGWLRALVRDGVPVPPDGNRMSKLRLLLPNLDFGKLPGLLARTIAAGTWNCPTLVVHDRIGALDNVEALTSRVQWLAMVPRGMIQFWDPKHDFRLKALTPDDYATLRDANVQRGKLLAALVAGNAPILVGTDTGNPYVVPGASLHDEIELMVKAGVSRPRVLRAATADAAVFLGTPHELGVIEAGARADLVLVAVDPLAQPLPLVPDGVMARGKWLPRSELDAKLAELAARNAAPPPTKDRWDGVPALVAPGKVDHEAGYDVGASGMSLGGERLVVVLDHGKRTVISQMVFDAGGHAELTYTLRPEGAELGVKSELGAIQLAGKRAGGKLAVTGTDGKGQPVALSADLPAGGVITGPGAGTAFLIAEQVARLPVGGKRTLAAAAIVGFPAPGAAAASLAVERKPDAGGNHVFVVTTTIGKQVAAGELVLDAKGSVVSYATGGPMGLTFTRRAR